jgi:outer membrane lipoprotein-sorting protein
VAPLKIALAPPRASRHIRVMTRPFPWFAALAAAACVALVSPALATPAEDARDLARISNYLNAIGTLEGGFVQVDPGGVVSEGDFYMRRPGRLRFEYDPPNPTLIVVDGFWVGVIDARDGGVDRVPLSDTPLSLLLKEDVDLRREGSVTNIERSADQLAVTARDPEGETPGEIVMVFSNNPLELRQWIVVDAQGAKTTVALRDMRRDVAIPNAQFVIENAARDN